MGPVCVIRHNDRGEQHRPIGDRVPHFGMGLYAEQDRRPGWQSPDARKSFVGDETPVPDDREKNYAG